MLPVIQKINLEVVRKNHVYMCRKREFIPFHFLENFDGHYNTMMASLLSQTKFSKWKLSESTKHGFPMLLLVKTESRVLLRLANSLLLGTP